MKKVPQVKVGIMNEPTLDFVLNGKYLENGKEVTGTHHAEVKEGKVFWNNELKDKIVFEPTDEENDSFELVDVTIGVNFHWERKENQVFRGALHLIVENDKITPVNVLSVEEYLLSVISSEMSATASLELLKAHAVISRSWLLAQMDKSKRLASEHEHYCACSQTEDELVRWYDREDHVNFDVCADDHCQRYQGITRASTDIVREAIKATWGEVVMAHAGDHIDNTIDPATGVKVYSLYGKTRKPTKEMLDDIDVLVYDIQDIGCRSFTFISTMGVAMEA